MQNFFEPDKLPKKTNTYAVAIAIICVIIYNIVFSIVFSNQMNALVDNYQESQHTAVDITDLFISDKFVDIYEELNILRNSSEMTSYLREPDAVPIIDEVEDMFVRYASNKNGLTQIRILDETGEEIVRVNKAKELIKRVPKSDLQNKFDRYYFQHAIVIDETQVYVSDFDLNIENGVIVEPYEPTIRFAAKLIDSSNQVKGILILNFDGEEFFSVINKYENLDVDNLEIGILDLNNYWSLNHSDMTDLDEIVVTVKSNQSDQMRDIFEKVQINSKDKDEGKFRNNGYHFYYKKIDEIDEDKYVFEGKSFSWYFVSFFDLKMLIANNHPYYANRVMVQIGSSIIVFFIGFTISRLLRQKKNQQILILTSAYISNNTHDGILVVNQSYEVVYCNVVFQDIYGYKLNEMLNRKITDFFEGNIHKAEIANDDDEVWSDNIWNKTKAGNWILKNLTIKEIRDSKDILIYYIGIYSTPVEVNPLNKSLEKLEYQSSLIYQDDIQKIGRYIDEMEKEYEEYMAITVQLMGDSRKLLESSQSVHGKFITAGQQEMQIDMGYNLIAVPRTDLLILVSPVVSNLDIAPGEAFIKPEDIIVERAMMDIDAMLKKLQIRLGYSNLECKYQTGVAISSLKTDSGTDIIQNSLIALEALTKYKKSSYLVYDEKYYEFIKYENTLRNELKGALSNQEFYIVYQPQFDVKTNEIMGVEALVRWQNATLGNVSPLKFIPIMEETDQIYQLGQTVAALVIDDLMKFDWEKMPSRVSINLTSKEFINRKVINDLVYMINTSRIEGISFCLEITETTLVENLEIANEIIHLLHEENIEVSIDDFGTGYSSLGYLKQLLADELKIDRMFIMDYPERDDGKIIKAIISMGGEIGMSMVVEGVETLEQLELIKTLKCESYQGYYGSKPTTLKAVYEMYKSKHNK